MTYKKAADALVAAGLLAKANVPSAISALDTTSIGLTYSDWAQALAKAGLIDKTKIDAAADAMEAAGATEIKDDPTTFNEELEDAGIL